MWKLLTNTTVTKIIMYKREAGTNISFKIIYLAGQVVTTNFYYPDITFDKKVITYAKIACIIYHAFNDLKIHFLCNLVAMFAYF